MARKLDPDEAEIWSRVAATVRPLAGRPRIRAAAAIASTLPRVPEPHIRPGLPVPPSRRTAGPAPDIATLDGSWDRQMRRGQLRPDRAIDLHGHSRDSAFALLSDAVHAAGHGGLRVLLVVTGKGSPDPARGRGVIRASLPLWLETPALRPFVAALRPAHPRHGGSGAWYVILKRHR